MGGERYFVPNREPGPGAERPTLASGDSIRNSFRCLSLDLEVTVRDRRIRAFAGVRADSGKALIFPTGRVGLAGALAKLDELSDGADFVLGHNLIEFDLAHLQAINPRLRLLRLPAVDTLRLNPLAFPRNPYHHLVKHYQDGQLRRGRINNPELDARLTLEVFDDQQNALKDAPAELLTAWHWLTTAKGGGGFDRVFASLRLSRRPSNSEALDAIRARLAGIVCQAQAREVMADVSTQGWPLAYALAWLSVSGATRSCHLGYDISFPRRDNWYADCGTPRVPILPVHGAVIVTMRRESLPDGSALTDSVQSRRTRTAGQCSNQSQRPQWRVSTCWQYCQRAPVNRSAIKSRPCPATTRPELLPW